MTGRLLAGEPVTVQLWPQHDAKATRRALSAIGVLEVT